MLGLQNVLTNTVIDSVTDHNIGRNFVSGVKTIYHDKATLFYFVIILSILFLGLFGPMLAPYPYNETQYTEGGEIMRLQSPSFAHPLGTTDLGYDVLSRILYGARATVITGLLGGLMIIGIGMSVGVTAGYFGGRIDGVLMRITDGVYTVPFIPFAIVLSTAVGVGFFSSIVVIGLILWRGNARVLRSQVLQIKERPYVLAAKASGASTPRILYKHIIPNIAPMAILFLALGIGYSIILQAGLAFVGVSNPFVPSWGIIVRNAYNSGAMSEAWWWSIPPGLLISLTVWVMFMFGRRYERLSNIGSDGEALVQTG